jgi:hypothetical protein
MPTGYVTKLAKEHNLSVDEAERRWSKAKGIAGKDGKSEDYAYITGIFKKMMKETSTMTAPRLNASARLQSILIASLERKKAVHLVTAAEAWWEEMTPRQKRQYIKDHPGSKYAKQAIRQEQKKSGTPAPAKPAAPAKSTSGGWLKNAKSARDRGSLEKEANHLDRYLKAKQKENPAKAEQYKEMQTKFNKRWNSGMRSDDLYDELEKLG